MVNCCDRDSGCVICDRLLPDIETAITEGWAPSYFEGETEIPGPVCGVCVMLVCRVAADGELELIK